MSDIVHVVRSDGIVEPFDPKKIIDIAIASGIHRAQAHLLAEKVTHHVQSLGLSRISGHDVRMIIAEELKTVDQKAANLFDWYQQSKLPDPEDIIEDQSDR